MIRITQKVLQEVQSRTPLEDIEYTKQCLRDMDTTNPILAAIVEEMTVNNVVIEGDKESALFLKGFMSLYSLIHTQESTLL